MLIDLEMIVGHKGVRYFCAPDIEERILSIMFKNENYSARSSDFLRFFSTFAMSLKHLLVFNQP